VCMSILKLCVTVIMCLRFYDGNIHVHALCVSVALVGALYVCVCVNTLRAPS